MQDIVIRFRRIGRIRRPTYEIIVINSKKHAYSGIYLEKIGFFNPNSSENIFCLNSERLGFWLNRGAKLRPSVLRYLGKFISHI
jgi:ribosomal protein S16